MARTRSTAVLSEVATVMERYGALLCSPSVEYDERTITLTVQIARPQPPDLFLLEFYNELRYLQDVGQLRQLATRYDIDPAALEALLRKAAARNEAHRRSDCQDEGITRRL